MNMVQIIEWTLVLFFIEGLKKNCKNELEEKSTMPCEF